MSIENGHMMFDEYNLHTLIVGIQNPTDIVATLNFSLYDTNDVEVERIANEMAYRLKLLMALCANRALTNQYLETILFSTGTRIPERVKVRELPPAMK
jgi:hypothetical protein